MVSVQCVYRNDDQPLLLFNGGSCMVNPYLDPPLCVYLSVLLIITSAKEATFLGLSTTLLVSKLTQKLTHGFWWNYSDKLHMGIRNL